MATVKSESRHSEAGLPESTPYVIMMGDVGVGKSTAVEKLAGTRGLSSNASESFTKASEWIPINHQPWGSLIICDTPGANSITDKFEQNLEVAKAMNFFPVSKVLISVKAETRLDSVVDNVRKYADRFVELPYGVVGVMVTHMDTVGWRQEQFLEVIEAELGLVDVVFSDPYTPRHVLLQNILKMCKEVFDICVSDNNFLKLFKIHNHNFKILQCTSREVEKFRSAMRHFKDIRRTFTDKEQVDLIFEFQAWMEDEVVAAQKRLAAENKFTFLGKQANNEAGHVANLTNQLRAILFDVRTEAVGMYSDHGLQELRKCPHCGLVWALLEGCTGTTTCGSRPSRVVDVRDRDFCVLATFSFLWQQGKLMINRKGNKDVKLRPGFNTAPGYGCGQSIAWNAMTPVPIPEEIRRAVVNITTEDVKDLPPAADPWRAGLDDLLNATRGSMRRMRLCSVLQCTAA